MKKDCRKKKKFACYHCGDLGHAVKDCPKKQGQRAGSTSGGQVHDLMAPGQEEGRKISVKSLIFFFDHPVHTLFDSGASHSLSLHH